MAIHLATEAPLAAESQVGKLEEELQLERDVRSTLLVPNRVDKVEEGEIEHTACCYAKWCSKKIPKALPSSSPLTGMPKNRNP